MSDITPPSNISYGTVTWRAAVDIADTDDVDTLPDYVAPAGTVTLTATTTKELDAGATPAPITILRAPIIGVLDDQGYLCTPLADGKTAGARGLKVIATDDPDLNPTGWLYNVTYDLRRAGKVIVSPGTHLLAVPTNATVDLTTIIPPDAADTIGIPQAEAAASAAAVSAAAAAAAVDTALATRTPGVELGYAEVFTTLTSTAADIGSAADLAGLSVTVVGKGRPVDIEFFCPSVTHSVSGTQVSADVVVNGDVVSARNQIGAAKSTATAAGTGPSLYVKRRAVLADGVSYTFTVRVFAFGVAGTSSLYAANPYQPQYLSVVSR